MPTRKQLYERWATEIEFPFTRSPDDPLYQSPEKYIQRMKEEMQNNNTPDQEQALKQQILEYLHTGLLFQRNLNGLINWLEELKEGEPDQENHLPDTNVGDIGQGWKTVKSDGLPAVGTDGLSEWQECFNESNHDHFIGYYDSTDDTWVCSHNSGSEHISSVTHYRKCYAPFETTPAPTYAARKKEKEISNLKEIALKLGERVREAEEANERLKKRNAALHSFIDKMFTADQVRQMLGDCADAIVKEFYKKGMPRAPIDYELVENFKQTTINSLMEPK